MKKRIAFVLVAGLMVVGYLLVQPESEPAPVAESASAVSTPVDRRVHPESAFPESVAVLIAEGALRRASLKRGHTTTTLN